jgi:hypothetical protein
MRWAALLDCNERVRGHNPIDRAGRGRLVEVYPAPAAAVSGLSTPESAGYTCDGRPAVLARRALLRGLTDVDGSRFALVLDETLVAGGRTPRVR